MIATVSAASSVTLDAEIADNEINSREAATFELHINNNERTPNQYLLSAPLTKWDVTFSDYIVRVPPHSTRSVDLRMAPPMNSMEGTYAIYIKAQDTSDQANSNFNYVQVKINEVINDAVKEISISEEVTDGWLVDTYKFTIENTGTLPYEGSQVDYFSELEYLLLDSTNNHGVENYGSDKKVTWDYLLEPRDSIQIAYTVSFVPILISGILLTSAIIAFLYFYLNRFNLTKTARRGKETISIKLGVSNKTNSEQETVRIEDFIPKPLKLVRQFGTAVPSQIISTKSGTRLIWKFDSLAPQEERMLSYELKSELHVIGKLQLPQAKLTQKKGGKLLSKVFSGKVELVGR